MKLKVNKIFSAIILSLVFLFSLNFYNRYYYFIYLAFLFFLFLPKQKIRINWSSLFLFVLGFSLLVFDSNSSKSITNMIRPFMFVLAYTIGISMFKINCSLQEREKQLSTLIYVLAIGAFLHYILNMYINKDITSRNTIDFWTGEALSATMQACLACLCVGVVSSFLFSNTSKRKKIIAIVFVLVILFYNLILAGRTLFFLMLIVFSIAFIYQNVNSKNKLAKNVIVLLSLIILMYLCYKQNIFGFKDIIENSNFFARFYSDNSSNIVEDKRFYYKLVYLKNLLDNPFGGNHIYSKYGFYAHDLYFDTYDQAGIFAFASIIIYIAISIARLIKCIRMKNIPFNTRQLIFCVYISVNIQFLLEPILQGVPWLLAAYCLIDGMVTTFISSQNKEITEVKQS